MASSPVPALDVMTLGLFGGSFNPPHIGHLAVAEACAEAAGLDRVLWMPAALAPHKRGHTAMASAPDRLAMTRAAVADNVRFEVSDLEIARQGVSYTVDTLRHLRDARPGDDWALILGGDSAVGFAAWREPRAILDLARLVIYARPGEDLDAVPAWVRDRALVVDGPLLDISSTQLRDRIAQGRTVRYLVPDPVRAIVADRRLYRDERGIGRAAGS